MESDEGRPFRRWRHWDEGRKNNEKWKVMSDEWKKTMLNVECLMEGKSDKWKAMSDE